MKKPDNCAVFLLVETHWRSTFITVLTVHAKTSLLYIFQQSMQAIIPLSAAAQACGRIRQLDIAPVVAEAMRRISNEESISAMFR